MHILSQPFSVVSIAVLIFFISPTLALKRTIGPPGNAHFINASNACDGTNPKNFEFGICSLLISCIYDNLDEAFKASLSSGTNIASLLPTVLVLIGELEFSTPNFPILLHFALNFSTITSNSRVFSIVIGLMELNARFATPRARPAGSFVAASSNRGLLLWHRSSEWPLSTIKAVAPTSLTYNCARAKSARMDSFLAIDLLQSLASSASEAGGGLHHHYFARRHAMEKCSGDEFYHGALAMRVYLPPACLVSLDQSA